MNTSPLRSTPGLTDAARAPAVSALEAVLSEKRAALARVAGPEALGVTLPLRAVFQAPTLQAFAERVQAASHLHSREEDRRRESAHPASGGAALEEVEF